MVLDHGPDVRTITTSRGQQHRGSTNFTLHVHVCAPSLLLSTDSNSRCGRPPPPHCSGSGWREEPSLAPPAVCHMLTFTSCASPAVVTFDLCSSRHSQIEFPVRSSRFSRGFVYLLRRLRRWNLKCLMGTENVFHFCLTCQSAQRPGGGLIPASISQCAGPTSVQGTTVQHGNPSIDRYPIRAGGGERPAC